MITLEGTCIDWPYNEVVIQGSTKKEVAKEAIKHLNKYKRNKGWAIKMRRD